MTTPDFHKLPHKPEAIINLWKTSQSGKIFVFSFEILGSVFFHWRTLDWLTNHCRKTSYRLHYPWRSHFRTVWRTTVRCPSSPSSPWSQILFFYFLKAWIFLLFITATSPNFPGFLRFFKGTISAQKEKWEFDLQSDSFLLYFLASINDLSINLMNGKW